MSLSIGIVGLPNAGKSTLFNALLKRQIADVAEYPFTTVEPNTGVVEVADERLDQLAEVLGIAKKVPAAVKFFDIAGLIKGAHEGEGLGNKFLAQIRQVDAILHLVRGFSDRNVPHISGQIDSVHDLNTVNLELTLADFEVVSKALKAQEKKLRFRRISKEKVGALKKVLKTLEKGKLAAEAGLSDEERELVEDLNLLTIKPVLYALNLDESAVAGVSGWEGVVSKDKAKTLPAVMLLSAKLEAEIYELSEKEQQEYLKQLGLKELLLDRLIRRCYELLDLITFFTVKGGKQAQAWPLEKGKTVLEAAEMIHTDLAKNFIKAEVIDWQELVKLGSWVKVREKGKLRLVGRDYVVKNGEVVEIHVAKR
jgi:hypothetical protein